MISEKMEAYVKEKEEKVKSFIEILKRICKLEMDIKEKTNTLMTETDWSTVISGRVTEAGKTAYIENELKDEIQEVEKEKTKKQIMKLEIQLLDDKLSVCRNAIREFTVNELNGGLQ